MLFDEIAVRVLSESMQMEGASERRTWRRRLLVWSLRVALGIVLLVLAGIALLYFKQHAALYHPQPYDARYANFLPPDGPYPSGQS